MSPKTKKQYEEIRQNRKTSIMKAALSLFADIGYNNVSVSKIAFEAGVSKGLLYNYFENKEMMLKEIIVQGIKQMMSDINEINESDVTRKTLISLINKNFEMMKTNFHYWKLYIAVISQPKVMAMVKDEILKLIVPFLTLISTYYKNKGVKNPLAYTFLIGSIMDGVALDYIMAPNEYPLDEVRELILEKLL